LTFSTKIDVAFIEGSEFFYSHQTSAIHREAIQQLKARSRNENVSVQLNHKFVANQQQARLALIKIIHSIKFLARQGLPLQVHDDCEGNLVGLLKLLSDDVADLKCLLLRKRT